MFTRVLSGAKSGFAISEASREGRGRKFRGTSALPKPREIALQWDAWPNQPETQNAGVEGDRGRWPWVMRKNGLEH